VSIKFPKIRINSFWSYQILGWFIYFATNLLLTLTISHVTWASLTIKISRILIGVFLTWLMRLFYKRLEIQSLNVISIILYSFVVSIIPSLIFYASTALLNIYLIGAVKPEIFFQLSRIISDFFVYNFPLFFGWSTLYFTIKFWMEWDNEKTRAEQAVALAHNAQMKMLRYQLNPHFLFNTLNSIRALIDENEKTARTLVTELSDFLRYSLISRNKSEVTLKEELDAIKHYLSIEKKRYENNLEINYYIDSHANSFPILSFLIHPLIDNAIKYGMQTSPMPLKIKISAEVVNNNLSLKVINSGKLLQNSNHFESIAGSGLDNIKARLLNTYPKKHKFDLYEKDGFVYALLEIYNSEGDSHEKTS
jgi:two-component system, LytTR family, sensor kinase